ncbi:MAG: SDR family oxidoreductase [Anaerolineae bacterium]|nr:SDR family oxidoreductase [Anaerolineae bacterium]
MTGQFSGKTVMVTGAGGQIARATVKHFADEGANLVLVDIAHEPLDACLQSLGRIEGAAITVVSNLNDPESVDDMVKQAEKTFATIDILVHTAGGFAAGKPVHETSVTVFDQQMMLNARILFITLGRVAKHMVENNVKGSMVAILARTGLAGAKNTAAYAASKAAGQRIVQSMALELKEHDIRVNGIMPSTADTSANRSAMPNANFDNWVTPKQIANTIAFLASDAASAISGDSLAVYNKA